MDKPFDPNEPDCSDGDFYCNLCQASMNSEQMWSSHIVGKRHIKNVAAYPNGLPRSKFDEENSFERPPKMGRYDDMDDYPPDHLGDGLLPPLPLDYPDYPGYPDYYEDDYYNRRPTQPYVPEVRRVVVHDYGHKKVDDPLLKNESQKPEEFLNGGKKIDILDSILDEVTKSVKKENGGSVEEVPKKDDFFEKLNEKFLAEDLAEEIIKKRLQEQKNKVESKNKATESSKEQKTDDRHSKEKKKRDISPDPLDNIYKYKDKQHLDSEKKSSSSSKSSSSKSLSSKSSSSRSSPSKTSSSKSSSSKSSSSKSSSSKSSSSKSSSSKSSSSKSLSSSSSESKKPPVKLDKIDPDDLTPDMLDDLLSSYLKPKMDSVVKETVSIEEPKKKGVNLDDTYVLAKKISDLPTKIFLQLALEKLRHVKLIDSEELQMIFQVICQAQSIICNKLPPQLQAVVKDKMSRNYSKSAESGVPSTSVSQQSTVSPAPNQVPTTNTQSSIAASFAASLIEKAGLSLNTTTASPAVQIQQPIMTQAGPITSVSQPAQTTPVLQSSTNQVFPQIAVPPQPIYPTPPPVYAVPLPMGALPASTYIPTNPYMYGAQVANANFPSATGVQFPPGFNPASWQKVTSATVSQSQPTVSTSFQSKITSSIKVPPPPNAPNTSSSSLLYQRFVAPNSLQASTINPNYNLSQMQTQAGAGGFSIASGVQSNSVNYSTAGQNVTNTNYYQTIASTVGNTPPVKSSSTVSVASSQSSKSMEAALASLKSLAEEYASKTKKQSKESEKKTVGNRANKWH